MLISGVQHDLYLSLLNFYFDTHITRNMNSLQVTKAFRQNGKKNLTYKDRLFLNAESLPASPDGCEGSGNGLYATHNTQRAGGLEVVKGMEKGSIRSGVSA